MNKLFSADFARLKMNLPFRIGMSVMALAGILFPIINYINFKKSGYAAELESCTFTYVIFLLIILSVFCSLFVGTDYSDGTVRNKIIVGHTRTKVYLSNFAICMVANIFLCFAYIVPYLAVGIPLMGFFKTDVIFIFITAAGAFVMSLAFTCLYLMVSMLNHNRASAAVICILGVFFMLFMGVFVESRLNEPETYSAYSYTDNTGTSMETEEPNPNYLSGKKREVYEFLYDFLPGCQAMRFNGMKADNIGLLAAYSVAICVMSTGCGLVLFKRKDLK